MIRVDIESIMMAAGPVPSVIVLRERRGDDSSESPLRALSIQTGSYEAAAISRGIDDSHLPASARPITHDVLIEAVRALGAKVERVEITRVDAPVFFASVVLARGDEEVKVDARPSDALSLAVRANAPMYVEDDVMNRAGSISLQAAPEDAEREIEQFDKFVQTLSPDDF